MSFWPLPTTLADALQAAASRGPVLEVGAGDGGFAARLASLGLSPLLLDIRATSGAAWPVVRADACQLPVRSGRLGLVTLADTLRAIPFADWSRLGLEIRAALAPEGCLVVLEDEPGARDEAEACYRGVLELLARVVPGRGACVGAGEVEHAMVSLFGEPVLRVEGENEEKVRDSTAPLRWLRATGRVDSEELDELEERVRRHGMCYGRFWARVFVGATA